MTLKEHKIALEKESASVKSKTKELNKRINKAQAELGSAEANFFKKVEKLEEVRSGGVDPNLLAPFEAECQDSLNVLCGKEDWIASAKQQLNKLNKLNSMLEYASKIAGEFKTDADFASSEVALTEGLARIQQENQNIQLTEVNENSAPTQRKTLKEKLSEIANGLKKGRGSEVIGYVGDGETIQVVDEGVKSFDENGTKSVEPTEDMSVVNYVPKKKRPIKEAFARIHKKGKADANKGLESEQ